MKIRAENCVTFVSLRLFVSRSNLFQSHLNTAPATLLDAVRERFNVNVQAIRVNRWSVMVAIVVLAQKVLTVNSKFSCSTVVL